LLDRKAASLFTPDSAVVNVKTDGKEWEVSIANYFSPYLKAKIEEFNAKRGKRNGGQLIEENGNGEAAEVAKPKVEFKPVTISKTGLELIEAVQFDTTLRGDGVWISNAALEDKAGPKEKIKGRYRLKTNRFKMKFRNIAGDEMVMEFPAGSPEPAASPKVRSPAKEKPGSRKKKSKKR
jgi:hypothetical protein